jgi:peptidyl-prolyl cis-trans isomerase SurA
LFDLTDKKVWSKAVSDSIGLEKFYDNNKNNYKWKERVHYSIYTCLNEKTKIESIKMFNKGKTQSEIFLKLNKKITGSISCKEIKNERTDATADKLWDKKGIVDITNAEGNFKFYFVNGVVNIENKSLKEAKGIITSDYQNQLEKDWIIDLRAKYKITVNNAAVNSLF